MLLLAFFSWQQYTLIESLVEPATHRTWFSYGATLGTYTACVFCYGLFQYFRKEALSIPAVVIIFVSTAILLYVGLRHVEYLTPWSIPRWLRGTDLTLKLFTFSIPTLMYCILAAVQYATPEDGGYKAWKNFLFAGLIPLGCFLFALVLFPILGNTLGGPFIDHVLIIGFVSVTVLFLFFLLRAMYILTMGKTDWIKNNRLIWLVPVAVIFPLLGLALNNGLIGDLSQGSGEGVFGDFSHPAFYILAGLNGLFLCLPAHEGRLYRLTLFISKAFLFTYILYFFFVFLPFLPLSIPLILALGLGFLILTPLLLLPVQLTALRDDFKYLTRYFTKPFLWATGSVFALLLPIFMTMNYLQDRTALAEALAYVYQPSESKGKVDTDDLADVLRVIRAHKSGARGTMFSEGTPFLTPYYNWLVLDNLMLSEAKLSILENVFLGEPAVSGTTPFRRNRNLASLDNVSVETSWDPADESWKSWVNLEMVNDSNTVGLAEFHMEFSLPPGTFISDYYLDIAGERQPGQLAERKAATWVYNQISRTGQDPGLLRYESANRVSLKVFPFRAGERRRTGIELVHKEPVELEFNGQKITLGRVGEHPVSEAVLLANATYLSAEEKGARPQVQRKVQVHYVVDASRRFKDEEADMVRRLQAFNAGLPAGSPKSRLTLAGIYPQEVDFASDWPATLANTPSGGFFAQRAIHNFLAGEIEQPGEFRQVIVMVGSGSNQPIITEGFSNLSAAFPEGDDFFFLELDTSLLTASFNDKSFRPKSNNAQLPSLVSVVRHEDLNGATHYLPADGKGSMVNLVNPTELKMGQGDRPVDGSWSEAAALWSTYLEDQRLGRTGRKPWLRNIQRSFETGILLPTTAYMVLENDAQREALRRKQAQVLSSNPALDLEEEDETQTMSEPTWLLWGGLGLFVLVVYRRRKRVAC
ncbi:MAG: hypothetical protein ACJAZ9_000906 [Neolewinella sp.]|jgi:hypothetical protein